MFRATNFTYDGIYSGIYGLQIASFQSDTVETTDAFSPTFNSVKSARANRFYHGGMKYDNAPSYPFSIISETEITDTTKREILSWLHCREGYKKLEIHQTDFEDYYYMCVFTNISLVYVNGRCHGFTVTAQFDSPYGYGKSTVYEHTFNDTNEHTINFVNRSDVVDGYIYPVIEFTPTGTYTDGDKTKYISIRNATDLSGLAMEFSASGGNVLQINQKVSVNGELRLISSDVSQNALVCFNKNWLKLKRGNNSLKIKIRGTVKITCPNYCLIGF